MSLILLFRYRFVKFIAEPARFELARGFKASASLAKRYLRPLRHGSKNICGGGEIRTHGPD